MGQAKIKTTLHIIESDDLPAILRQAASWVEKNKTEIFNKITIVDDGMSFRCRIFTAPKQAVADELLPAGQN